MGLDITYYRKLKVAEGVELDEDGNPKDYDNFWKPGVSLDWSNEAFPGRADDVDAKAVYSFAESDGFRAGSYGGYNFWRDHLAQLVGHTSAEAVFNDPKPGPFVELINFADNEGVIGAAVSAKLAKDFTEWQDRATAFAAKMPDGEYWIYKYAQWRKAFETAADGGAVDFH